MISIIISSANKQQLFDVTQNIADTIAIPYELIAFDNSDGKMGICEVYNKGIEQAKFDVLCFMHEDVSIKTQAWGQKVVDIFKDKTIGLVGVAGSVYKPLTPSGWTGTGVSTDCLNIIQSHKYNDKPPKHHHRNHNNEPLAHVAAVDGVWLCTTREIAKKIKFDDQTFKGFHAYDVDFSIAIGQLYKVVVTYDLLLNHFSEGNYDRTWLTEILKLHKKWTGHLPINTGNLTMKEVLRIEKVTFKEFVSRLAAWDMPISIALKTLRHNNDFMKLSPGLFLKLHFYALKIYSKGKKKVTDQIS